MADSWSPCNPCNNGAAPNKHIVYPEIDLYIILLALQGYHEVPHSILLIWCKLVLSLSAFDILPMT